MKNGLKMAKNKDRSYKIYVNSEEMDSILNLSPYNIIKLPSKSSGFVSFNKFKKADFDNSILSCGIFNQTTENIFSFGKYSELEKSSSLVINILFSDFENVASSPLPRPFCFEIMSTPFSFKNFSSLLSTFSSDRNLIKRDAELDIVSSSHQTGCIMQGCFNMVLSNGRKCFEYFFYRHSCFKHLQNLPDHNSCTPKSRFAMTNFCVCNNILINLNSHNRNKIIEIFKYIDNILIRKLNN